MWSFTRWAAAAADSTAVRAEAAGSLISAQASTRFPPVSPRRTLVYVRATPAPGELGGEATPFVTEEAA